MIDFNQKTPFLAIEKLEQAQEANKEQRDSAIRQETFLYVVDGMYNPGDTQGIDDANRPRYSLDLISPVIDQIMYNMEETDFYLTARPAGGNATKEIANTYSGMFRNIENISDAEETYSSSTRTVVESGIDGWRIVQKWVDDDSFDQDLVIEDIPNFKSRVWFDPNAIRQDMSDAKYCFVITSYHIDTFNYKWPKASDQSVPDCRYDEHYWFKKEEVLVGEVLWMRKEKRELIQMNNGDVYEVNEDYETIKDELALKGIVPAIDPETGEERRRERPKNVVYSRLFNGNEWLDKERKTVFQYLPVVPEYGNFKIVDNVVTHKGLTLNAMDLSEIINYAISRNAEEGALAPRDKIFMTTKMAGPHMEKIQTMNVNADPVQFFEPDAALPGAMPFRMGPPQMNPHLMTTFTTATDMINRVLGMFSANMGDNPGLQSGVAIQQQVDRGDQGSKKWFGSRQIAQRHTGRILKSAMPLVYTQDRTIRILNQDGTDEYVNLWESEIDQQTQRNVYVNDLSKGHYDVICEVGPAFKTQQDQTIKNILDLAQFDPGIIERQKDVIFNNMSYPGAKDIYERERYFMVVNGLIPEFQFTDEEKEMMQQLQAQQQQTQQPDPASMIAQAEMKKAQNTENKIVADMNTSMARIELDKTKLATENDKFMMKMELENQKFQAAMSKQFMDMRKQQEEIVKIMAESAKIIRESSGADAIVTPSVPAAYNKQMADLNNEISRDGEPVTQLTGDRPQGPASGPGEGIV